MQRSYVDYLLSLGSIEYEIASSWHTQGRYNINIEKEWPFEYHGILVLLASCQAQCSFCPPKKALHRRGSVSSYADVLWARHEKILLAHRSG